MFRKWRSVLNIYLVQKMGGMHWTFILFRTRRSVLNIYLVQKMEECTEHSSCSVKGKVYLTFILFSKRKSILNILLSYSEQITDRRIGRCKYEGSTQLGRNAVNYSEISEFKMIHFISVRRKKAVLRIRIQPILNKYRYIYK